MPDRYASKYLIFNFKDIASPISRPGGLGQVATYESVYKFPGWDGARDWVIELIQKFGVKSVLEVGSGANPTLLPQDVRDLGLRYTSNDVSAEELSKADKVFDTWVCDISGDFSSIPLGKRNSYDLVFSRMVNEHVKDGGAYHGNIQQLLKPGGIAAHCFSTLYCLPFTVNRMAPDFLSSTLLNIFMPRDTHRLGKFKAYYSWSRGPSSAMFGRFLSLGYEVIDYCGYFGHAYYARVPLLHWLESRKTRLLLHHPIPGLCSYGSLILRKPL